MPRLIPGITLLCCLLACSSNDPTEPETGPPSGPPGTVTDLHVDTATNQSITLAWTAPGVAGHDRALATYDLRRAALGDEPDDPNDWQPVDLTPPATPGTAELTTISELAPGSTWVFHLRSRSNDTWSARSASVVATANPQWDQTPPAAITDLELRWRSETELLVTWSATGDDADHGTATTYEVRHADQTLDQNNWTAATVAPAPSHDSILDRWTCLVTGLDDDTVVHLAVRAQDDAGHWSDLAGGVEAAPPTGTVWHVHQDGTGTVPTIAEGIRRAGYGDLVLVHPGRYTWTNQGGPMHELGMIFVGRDTTDFTIASLAGPEATILDAEQQGRVVFIQGYNDGLVIEGFTITGGVSTAADGETPKAGGLTFHLTSTTVRDCVFEGNRGDNQGGAVYFGGVGTPTLEHCVFRDNHAGEFGGAVFAVNVHGSDGDPDHGLSLLDCVVENNTAGFSGGGLCIANAVMLVEDCIISGNHATASGGGIRVAGHAIEGNADSWVALSRCTMTGNTSPLGAAVRVTDNGDSRPGRARMTSCIVAAHGDEQWLSKDSVSTVEIGCSDLHGNAGDPVLPTGFTDVGDNFWLDPLFCGGDGQSPWFLDTASPCLPGAHPNGADCGLIGARETGCGS